MRNTKACKDTEQWKLAQIKSRASQKAQYEVRLLEYNKNPKLCKGCTAPIPYSLMRGVPKRVFCSRSCAARFNNKQRVKPRKPLYCLGCNTLIVKSVWASPDRRPFCTQQCRSDLEYKTFINNWLAGQIDGGRKGGYVSNHVKRYLLEQCKDRCSRCGWGDLNTFTQKIPLEVDHKDGNCLNNNLSNLIILCPNCHALTSTYKGANKGKGRSAKNVYNGEGYNLLHPKNYRKSFK